MISLAECAPCRARRLQEESEAEFKKRYGMVDLNRAPVRMGWKPFMGQVTAAFPAAGEAVPTTQKSEYVKTTIERLLYFGSGAGLGFPIGILANVAFKSLRRYRHEAATFALMASGVGLAVSLLPFPKSEFLNIVARVSGILTGSALSDMALPLKKQDAIVAPV